HACDLLCLATDVVPANELLLQGGMRYHYLGGRWRPVGSVPGLLAAGAVAGLSGLDAHLADGRMRGREAAALLGYSVTEPPGLPYPGSAFAAGSGTELENQLGKESAGNANLGKCFVCLCEDVTVKDIDQAVAEGFDNIETLKRYATVNMGPCQGK